MFQRPVAFVNAISLKTFQNFMLFEVAGFARIQQVFDNTLNSCEFSYRPKGCLSLFRRKNLRLLCMIVTSMVMLMNDLRDIRLVVNSNR